MFEHKTQPLAPRTRFFLRLARHFAWTLLIVGFSLAMGSTGYHYIAGLTWIDAFYNSAMILTGMGPVSDTPMRDAPSKLFSAFYALYSGIAFLTMVATLLAPVAHRFMHRLHLEFEEEDEVDSAAGEQKERKSK
jgi:hypothetical protein